MMIRAHRTPLAGAVVVLTLTFWLPTPASAQIDLSGEWASRLHEDEPHRQAGPNNDPGGRHGADIGDYTGLPINAAGRLRADSWDAGIQTLPEHQVDPAGSAYSVVGISSMRITKVVDDVTQQLIAYKITRAPGGSSGIRMIWMDGRPHPPAYAPHTWEGFATGTWTGDMLTVETTHMKTGYLQLNGVPHSDLATMTEHFVRHGDVLTLIAVVDDPVYLDEPLIRSSNYVIDLGQQLNMPVFQIADEIAGRKPGDVPSHVLDSNPFLHEFSELYHIPFEATRGGKESIYPEYRMTIDALKTTSMTSATSAKRSQKSRPAP